MTLLRRDVSPLYMWARKRKASFGQTQLERKHAKTLHRMLTRMPRVVSSSKSEQE